MIVSAWNPETKDLERTNLTVLAPIGASSLTVKNADRVAYNNILLLGGMGYETSEVISVNTSGLTTTNIPLVGTTKFAHAADDPIYVLRYDKVLFYSSTTVTGTKTLISTQTIDVDNADKKTYYDDLSGTSGTYYWTKFQNSYTLEETAYSSPIRASGPDQHSISQVISVAIDRLSDPGYTLITPDGYLALAQEVNDDLISQTTRPYKFLRRTKAIDRTANQGWIANPTDYFKFDWLEYDNTVNGITRSRQLIPIPMRQFIRNNQTGTSIYKGNYTTAIALDEENDRVLIRPTPSTTQVGAYTMYYYKSFTAITDPAQIVETPNSLVYKYKFLAEGYRVKAERDQQFLQLANFYETKYGNEIVKMQRMTVKDVGTGKSFASSEETSSTRHYPTRRYVL